MENKKVGILLLGISIAIIAIVLLYNNTLNEYINTTCPLAHDDVVKCPAQKTIQNQTLLSLFIVTVLVVVSIVLISSKPDEKVIVKKIREKEKKRKVDLSEFTKEEKKIYNLIRENKAIFQADLIEKSGFGKVKITRILDRLEGRELIERKRRGMTNVIVPK